MVPGGERRVSSASSWREIVSRLSPRGIGVRCSSRIALPRLSTPPLSVSFADAGEVGLEQIVADQHPTGP